MELWSCMTKTRVRILWWAVMEFVNIYQWYVSPMLKYGSVFDVQFVLINLQHCGKPGTCVMYSIVPVLNVMFDCTFVLVHYVLLPALLRGSLLFGYTCNSCGLSVEINALLSSSSLLLLLVLLLLTTTNRKPHTGKPTLSYRCPRMTVKGH